MPDKPINISAVAIQGELGSNSHMAALEMLGHVAVVPCAVSADVLQAVLQGRVDCAVLPIENSLHGSVAEHYDLLLQHPVRIELESQLRIRHNLIAAQGVALSDIRTVISHPVALSQCRVFLGELSGVQVAPFYDTAGSVKHIMEHGLRDTAGVAPELASTQYGGQILVRSIEDHTENYTRFYLLGRSDNESPRTQKPKKCTVAFTLDHRPGTLVTALHAISEAGVNLTRIESRPVPGKPWEYVFYVDFRFEQPHAADRALAAIQPFCGMVKELGRYVAA